jgi:beta-phosphoglucomutase-like phosphatase (HAD superfamily)
MDNIIKEYNLFIFDLDDTIIQTEKLHYKAWLLTLQNTIGDNFFISSDTFFNIFHSINQNSIQNYLESLFAIENVTEIINLKNKIFIDIINECKNDIKMVEGCNEFIEKIIEHDKKFIIVSNTLKINIDFFSDLFPILKKSTKNYYRELFKLKKPNPECYLKVVHDFPDMKMVGFEDSITGIQALTRVPQIIAYYINNKEYVHHNYILENYNIIHINNYKDF